MLIHIKTSNYVGRFKYTLFNSTLDGSNNTLCSLQVENSSIANTMFDVLQSVISWISFPVFFSQSFNKFVLLTGLAYTIGAIMQLLFVHTVPRTWNAEQFSQVCLAISTVFPFIKILRLLSVGKYIGPKLQMIKEMASPIQSLSFCQWLYALLNVT